MFWKPLFYLTNNLESWLSLLPIMLRSPGCPAHLNWPSDAPEFAFLHLPWLPLKDLRANGKPRRWQAWPDWRLNALSLVISHHDWLLFGPGKIILKAQTLWSNKWLLFFSLSSHFRHAEFYFTVVAEGPLHHTAGSPLYLRNIS